MIVRAHSLLCLLALGWLVAGCSPRPGSDVLDPVSRPPGFTSKVDMLVATTRARAADSTVFTEKRADHINYAAMQVSIPRKHTAGNIEWSDQGDPDPAYHFLTARREFLTDRDFLRRIEQRVMAGGPEAGAVLVFVHGYNTLYQEAVYRFAQIIHDSGFKGTAVLFAWPSRGKAPLYLADRDASTYSRDYLEETLLEIAKLRGVNEINLLAHSMGNWLAVETLRQAKLKGHGDFRGKLADVVLASPDIDITVFRTQLDVIAPMKRPITVMVSGDDQALATSTWLAGGVKRVGLFTLDKNNPQVAAAIKRYNLRVIDLTKIEDGAGNHHSKFAQGPIIRAIGQSLASHDQHASQKGGIANVVTNVLNVPAAIVGGAAAAE